MCIMYKQCVWGIYNVYLISILQYILVYHVNIIRVIIFFPIENEMLKFLYNWSEFKFVISFT